MKLLLTSQGFEENIEIGKELLKLVGKKPSNIKVFLVSTADKNDQEWQWVKYTVKQLEKIGISSKNISIFSLNRKINKEELKDIDVVYVCGGNTFLYLDGIRKTGLDKEIKKFVKNGGVYFGVSAGSCVVSPTIEVAGWEPLADKNIIKLKDLKALNIIPFFVFPHFEENDCPVIEKSASKTKYPVIAINDKQAVLVKDDDIQIIGIGEEVIFNSK